MPEGTPAPTPDSNFPAELLAPAQALESALQAGQPVDKCFADFCSRAYVKPEWAGPASEFLAELFEGREAMLAAMTRVPDLIIELASGQQTLTTIVAFEWAAAADAARLSKLSEALAATHGKMHNPEVVHLMLALASSLAITRYPRAEQMLNLAEPQVEEEHQESLAEARLWMAAGRILRGSSQEVRELWNHRLRRRRTAWTWDSPAERAALQELADHLRPGQEGMELFQSIVPSSWWQIAVQLATERAALRELYEQRHPELASTLPKGRVSSENEDASAMPQAHASALSEGSAPSPAPRTNEPQVMVMNAWPFFLGGLVGAAALAVVIAISPYDLKKTSLKGNTEPGTAAPPSTAVPLTLPANQANLNWVQEQLTRIQAGSDDLKALWSRVQRGTWAENQALLKGETPELTAEDPRRLRLLIWLHLDPPDDKTMQSELPALLASIRADSDTLELWENVAGARSVMEKAVREAARRQIYANATAWSPSQKEQLNQLGWPVAPP